MASFGEAAAREAAAHWGHGPLTEFRLLCVSENATWLLRDPVTGERTVLRLNRPGYHPLPALESELSWTSALLTDGVVCTPRVLSNRGGARVSTLATGSPGHPARHAVMFSFAEGVEPNDASLLAVMPIVGGIAARLHTHARGWVRPAGFTRWSWDLASALGSSEQPGRWGDWRAGASAARLAVLTRAAAQLTEDLLAYGFHDRQFGLIHSDLRAANLLLRDDDPGSATVIDFDDCAFSWYAYDLAASVSFIEHRADLPQLVACWLEGYRQAGSFQDEDVEVLPALVMMRRLQLLAWSASHADTEMARSLGDSFAEDSAGVAARYLSKTLLDGVT